MVSSITVLQSKLCISFTQLFFLNYFSSSISVIYPVIQSRPSLAILFNRLHCQWKENSSSLFWVNQAPLKFSIIVPQPNSDSSAAAGWLCVRWFTLSWQHLFPECSTCHSASVFSEAACLAKTQHSLIVRGRESLYSQKKTSVNSRWKPVDKWPSLSSLQFWITPEASTLLLRGPSPSHISFAHSCDTDNATFQASCSSLPHAKSLSHTLLVEKP